jgi:hypothetical protein
MSEVWTTIVALTLATIVIKGAGPAVAPCRRRPCASSRCSPPLYSRP